MKKAAKRTATALCLVLFGASEAAAQHAYPAQGQSPSKQAEDQAECDRWATQQTGYDPARPPPVAMATPAPVTGSGARARGAAAGAVIGGVSGGDAGSGAVAGAAVGGLARRGANRRAADAQNQAAAQQAQSTQASFDRARAACLSGRGYSVR
jgi:hypothetical protein